MLSSWISLRLLKRFNATPQAISLRSMGNILDRIRYFLLDRTLEASLDGTTSSTCSMSSGVPRESIVPFLFLVYNIDMPIIIKSPARLFAYDCDPLSRKIAPNSNTI